MVGITRRIVFFKHKNWWYNPVILIFYSWEKTTTCHGDMVGGFGVTTDHPCYWPWSTHWTHLKKPKQGPNGVGHMSGWTRSMIRWMVAKSESRVKKGGLSNEWFSAIPDGAGFLPSTVSFTLVGFIPCLLLTQALKKCSGCPSNSKRSRPVAPTAMMQVAIW